MRRFWMVALAVCVLATAAQAGTIHKFSFTGSITDVEAGGTAISVGDTITGSFEIDEDDLPTPKISTSTEKLWEGISQNPFITWKVTVGSYTYSQEILPTSGVFVDLLHVVDENGIGADSITLLSTRGVSDYGFGLLLETSTTGNAIDSSDIPTLVASAWDKTAQVTYTLPSVTDSQKNTIPALKFTANIVPVPAAAWLGLGLLGALGIIRRIRRRK